MGRTIEKYRACIGTYNNCLKAKDMPRFESVFWNTIVVLLTHSLYLLVCLYILLRIANDVEENSGPTL